jgi:hypothetical protein
MDIELFAVAGETVHVPGKALAPLDGMIAVTISAASL